MLGNYAEKLRSRFGSFGDIGQNAANTPRDYRTLRLELAPDLCDSFGRQLQDYMQQSRLSQAEKSLLLVVSEYLDELDGQHRLADLVCGTLSVYLIQVEHVEQLLK